MGEIGDRERQLRLMREERFRRRNQPSPRLQAVTLGPVKVVQPSASLQAVAVSTESTESAERPGSVRGTATQALEDEIAHLKRRLAKAHTEIERLMALSGSDGCPVCKARREADVVRKRKKKHDR